MELRTSGSVDYFQDDALQGGGVARHKVKAHHMPMYPVCQQLEADDIVSMLLVSLYRKSWKLFEKECYASTSGN